MSSSPQLQPSLIPPVWMNRSITLYHGTLRKHANNIVNGIDLSRCNPETDFGQGFYTTTILRQAESWAWALHSEIENDSDRQLTDNEPVVVRFDVDRESLSNLNHLGFIDGQYDAEDFWSLIFHCRQQLNNGHERTGLQPFYDVVYGPVADFWRQRSNKANADQISFHTDTAVALLNQSIDRTFINVV